jgi:hypothetical protein
MATIPARGDTFDFAAYLRSTIDDFPATHALGVYRVSER